MQKESICVYLDQNNIYHRYQKIDHKKLLEYIANRYNIIRATSYNSIDYSNQAQKNFTTYLVNQNWRCKTVDSKINSNIDAMINVDLVNDCKTLKPDWVCVISCDGDFSYALDLVASHGIKVFVIGCKENTSLELLKLSDKNVNLESIPNVILNKSGE